MKKVVIESPFAGDVEKNVAYARACMRDSIVHFGEAPIASHLLYTQPGILDDDKADERLLGIECGLIWGEEAELTAVYTDLGHSRGMEFGIARAEKIGREVVYRALNNFEEFLQNYEATKNLAATELAD